MFQVFKKLSYLRISLFKWSKDFKYFLNLSWDNVVYNFLLDLLMVENDVDLIYFDKFN